MHNAIELIKAERERQVSAEGYTPQHDDAHKMGQMAGAAAVYALHACGFENPHALEAARPTVLFKVRIWPWSDGYWKPSDDPICDLVKAGALIVAEIERLQREVRSNG